uniref:NADH dehydrogenase subunit 6 n=1 Tax=Panagrolaimus sp. PS1159 TaxID=55785 RepID=A0AC35GCE2_9BILA
MLFMNRTPIDAEAVKYEEYSIPDQNAARNNLKAISIALTIFYLFLSLFTVIFYPPLSFFSLMFPFITILLVFCALRNKSKDAFWPCILMASLGLILKLVACIVFLSLFGFSGFSSTDNRKLPNPRTLLSKKDPESFASDMRALFFTILTGAELFLLIISCCVKLHLVAFQKCMQSQ